MRLALTGVMVDGIAEPGEPLVTAGIITPCGDLAAQIDGCDEDLTLAINSYGGTVDGGIQLSIALANLVARGHSLAVEIGAICASAAANMVARLPRQATVLVHPESLIMYHSCEGLVAGSPDALRDSADRMDKVNEVVIRSLAARTSLEEGMVRGWFASGREGWLNGLDALACGLASGYATDEILPAPAMPPEGTEERGWKYAAIAAIANQIKEIAAMAEEKKIEVEEGKPPVAEGEEDIVKEVVEELKDDERKEDPVQEPVAEGEDEIAALKAENEELKKELEALKATCDKLTSGLKAPANATAPKKDFAALVREIPTDISANEYARRFTALKKEHKAEYDAYMASHK